MSETSVTAQKTEYIHSEFDDDLEYKTLTGTVHRYGLVSAD